MTELLTPIDTFLAAQQGTPVDRFARHHELVADDTAPRRWEERLPTAGPGPGQQYAFRVDLDSCSGCKSCVAACHSLNGLDAGESWRTVGTLLDAGDGGVQTVPSGCHHCIEPACLAGCPTKAYEKDPVSGIVFHLDDQCFGCGYCELTCPYEVPTMNARLGVVRKCDMCADRLADGEAPACVQACPTGAITIDVVDRDDVVRTTATGTLVPGAPASSMTQPSTRYVSSRPLGEHAVAADAHAVRPADAHPPLAFFLVIGQVSVGTWCVALAAMLTGADPTTGSVVGMLGIATAAALAALAGSVSHLGRPLLAWRAVLGVGHSWLSREIVTFGAYVGLALTTTAAARASAGPAALGVVITASAGVAGVWCSALLYAVTHRAWWRRSIIVPKFLGTAAAGGGATASASAAWWPGGASVTALALVAAASVVGKMFVEWLGVATTRHPDIARTRLLLTGALVISTRWRIGLGVIGALALLAAAGAGSSGDVGSARFLATAAVAFVVAGELVERRQFFVASVAPRMPGGLSA